MIYEVMVIQNPTAEEKKKGKLEKIIHKPDWLVASDEGRAMMKTAMKLNLDLDDDRLEVLCRPFN